MRTSNVNMFIMEILGGCGCHMTAQQIYDQVKLRLPAVNASTVYRSLERLAHTGKISVSDLGLGAAVYEAVQAERHHHLVCQECGTMLTLSDDEVKELFTALKERYNFELTTNHLVLFGVCSYCQPKDASGSDQNETG